MSRAVVKALVERFGQDKVKVCTAFHVQVLTDKGPHNIWTGDTLKLQLAGTRKAQNCGGLRKLLDRISGHKHEQTAHHEMTEAHRLAQFIGHVVAQKKDGIWVDAGWKALHRTSATEPGSCKARMAYVCVKGEVVTARSWTYPHANPFSGEMEAIWAGVELDPELPVFSDCKQAVERVALDRVKWVPREQNTVADSIGNMRNGTL